MRIQDSQALLHHIRAGAAFEVSKGGLRALNGVAHHWARLLDHFRPASALADREARVLTAMTELLRPQSPHGPRDLAADSPRTGTPVRQRLGEARTTFMTALVQAALERESAQPARHSRLGGFSLAERTVLGTALGKALSDVSLTGQSSPRDMQALAQSAAVQAGQAVDRELLAVLADPDAHLPEPTACRERLEATVQRSLTEALGQAGDFAADHLHRDAAASLVRDRPAIDGFRVAGSAEDAYRQARVLSDYSRMLDDFCRSPTEKRVLSYLLTLGPALAAAAFSSPQGEFMGSGSSFSEVSSVVSGASTSVSSPSGPPSPVPTAGGAQYALSRNHNGDSVIDYVIPVSVPGRLLTVALPDGTAVAVGPSAPLAALRGRLLVPLVEGDAARQGPPLPLAPRPPRAPVEETGNRSPRSGVEAWYEVPRSSPIPPERAVARKIPVAPDEPVYQNVGDTLYENTRDVTMEHIYESLDIDESDVAPSAIDIPVLLSELHWDRNRTHDFTRL